MQTFHGKRLTAAKRPLPLALLLAAATLPLALLLAGCSSKPSAPAGFEQASMTNGGTTTPRSGDDSNTPAQQALPIRLLLMLDASGSVDRTRREQNVQFLLPAIRFAIGRAQMTFCLFDVDVREIGSPNFQKTGDFIKMMQQEYLPQPPGSDTRFAPIAQRIIAEEAKAEQAHQRLVVVITSDGGFSDLSEVARMAEPLKELKALTCLAIGPMTYERAGSNGSYYDTIKKDFDCFEERRIILFPEDPQIAAEKARELEDKLR